MKITFPKETYEEIRKAGPKSEALQEKSVWGDKIIDSRQIEESDLDLISKVVVDKKLDQFIEGKRIIRKIANIKKLGEGGAKKLKIKRLDMLAEAIFALMKDLKRKWVFASMEEGAPVMPYFVDSVTYCEPRHGGEPFTQMVLKAFSRGKRVSESVSFHRKDLGKTAGEIFIDKGLMLETDDLVADHEADLKRYHVEAPKTGEQYVAVGIARQYGESRWNREVIHMEIEGRPAKVVMDDRVEYGGKEGEDSAFHATSFWESGGTDDEDEDRMKGYEVPTHPVMRAFDLWRHEFVLIHISNIQPYVYDTEMARKIVLPAEHSRLVEALTVGTAMQFEDIVKGKAAGVIILCTGLPGTGKTLTAEVYSEVAKRPLYIVQCSQLGTDPDELEKNLATVLERATRWKAILLIDEADVYIHERGSDVNQNAIVGVFLRLLEYYNGILFMNTNREEVIDDAILSRATAHIHYSKPTSMAAMRIWKILADRFGVKMDDDMLAHCMKEWGGVSGRTMRQILRLARMIAEREKCETTVDHLSFAASFQGLT